MEESVKTAPRTEKKKKKKAKQAGARLTDKRSAEHEESTNNAPRVFAQLTDPLCQTG